MSAARGNYPRGLPYASRRPDPPAARHLEVRRRGEVVGHVVVNPWRRVAGIYEMGVIESHRRRGIGRALTTAACRQARDLGCTHAVLNATGEGALLYREVGLQSLGLGCTWWRHPGPRPTARQAALVKAIGFGDMDGPASLRLNGAELERRIPGAGAPLAVAGQAAVVDWILQRWADLVSRPVDPRGATLLHVAVEWDNAELVAMALARGADRLARDDTWNGTALGGPNTWIARAGATIPASPAARNRTEVLRPDDVLARVGGHEVAVLPPARTEVKAADVIGRLRARTLRPLTCSVGPATWDRVELADRLMVRAADTLYDAQRDGPGRARFTYSRS